MIFSKHPKNNYEVALQGPRREFRATSVVKEMLSGNVDPVFIELSIIYWSALSSGFVKPVADYLRLAGDRCQEMELPEMVRFFRRHAEEEEGHDDWAVKDTHRLVARWNKRHPAIPLDAGELLDQRMSPAVLRYHQLHQNVIEGKAPYAELAIDLEIELITKNFGPRMLLQCIKKIGPHILWEMIFLREHVRFDFGHTDKNVETLNQLLQKHPDFVAKLVETGKAALNAYADLLEDCRGLAKEKMGPFSKNAA